MPVDTLNEDGSHLQRRDRRACASSRVYTIFYILGCCSWKREKRESRDTKKGKGKMTRPASPSVCLLFFFITALVVVEMDKNGAVLLREMLSVFFFSSICCFFFGSVGMLVLLLVGCCSIVGQLFRFSAHVRFRLSCCEFFGMNRDSSFLRVQQSGQPTVSPDHLLGASDGSKHFLLVSEQGGSDFVQLGDVVHDEEDVSLASGVGRLHSDDAGLLGVEVASGALEDGLLLAQSGGGSLLLGGQFSLGLLQLGREIGLLLSRLLLQSVELLLGLGSEIFGGLDSLHISHSNSAHAFDGGGEAGLLGGEFAVDSLDGFALGDSAGQHGLDLGQSLGHRLLARLLGHLGQDLAHLALDQGVELEPAPTADGVVDSDVSLDGGEKVLLGLEVVVFGELHEDNSGGTLHLEDDLGQRTFTDLLELGETTGAEHDLGGAATEFVGVESDLDESLGGAALGIAGHVGEDLGRDDGVTGHEVGVGDLVGQTQHANTDALEHAVAVKLVHDERSVDVSGLLDLVGDNATHEVRMGRVQVGHQLHQRLSVGSGNGHHRGTLLLGTVILLSEDKGDNWVGGLSHHANDGFVDGILVLKEPTGDVVSDGTGVVVDLEMSLRLALLGGLGLAKGLVLAQVLAHHLLQVGLVSGLGDDALLLQHGQDTHLLLDQLDGDDQVHTKVDESPLDTLALVLFLLLNKHVVVEELLKTLVGVVDEKLFQDVELENLETGDVQDADEILSRIGGVQRVVDKGNNPIEHTGEEGLGSGGDGESHLLQILTLLDEIFADLQLGLHEGIDEVVDLNGEQIGSLGDILHAVGLSLLLTTLLLPLLVTQVS